MTTSRTWRRERQDHLAVTAPGTSEFPDQTVPTSRASAASPDLIADRAALAARPAVRALAGCVASTVRLLWRREIHVPAGRVGTRISFADGTSALVYRETVAGQGVAQDPCVLVVEFRLRGVRGRGHVAFRRESLLNTPLFVGFPGFVSKLWLAHDERGRYRGLYEWDGPQRADHYARALWRVLALVSARGSIHYIVLPGLRRDALVAEPRGLPGGQEPDAAAWWRPVRAWLTLALQAHAHGAAVRVIDRREQADRPSRALILHARSLEVLRPLGVTQALLAKADIAPVADLHLGGRALRVRLGDLDLPDTAFPHLSLMRQRDVERVLARALADRGVAAHAAAARLARVTGCPIAS
jgi:hypothetical protein